MPLPNNKTFIANMIFVFKTSVKTKIQIKKLKPHIDKILPCAKWNFDLEDVDKILRIDTEQNIGLTIIDLLNIHSYSCEELA
jgi:hypothetical protein